MATEKQMCACGASVKNPNHRMHVTSVKHQSWATSQEGAPVTTTGQTVILEDQPDPEKVHPDVLTIVAYMKNAQMAPEVRHVIVAREMRGLFARNFWPNEEQPLTVLQMLQKHNVPIGTPARALTAQAETEVTPPKVGEKLIRGGVAVPA